MCNRVIPTRQECTNSSSNVSFLLTVLLTGHAKLRVKKGDWPSKAGGEGKEEVVERLRNRRAG